MPDLNFSETLIVSLIAGTTSGVVVALGNRWMHSVKDKALIRKEKKQQLKELVEAAMRLRFDFQYMIAVLGRMASAPPEEQKFDLKIGIEENLQLRIKIESFAITPFRVLEDDINHLTEAYEQIEVLGPEYLDHGKIMAILYLT